MDDPLDCFVFYAHVCWLNQVIYRISFPENTFDSHIIFSNELQCLVFFEEFLEAFPAGRVITRASPLCRLRGDSVTRWLQEGRGALCSARAVCSDRFARFCSRKMMGILSSWSHPKRLRFCFKDLKDIDFRFGPSNLILEFHCLELEILESNQPNYFRLETHWLLLVAILGQIKRSSNQLWSWGSMLKLGGCILPGDNWWWSQLSTLQVGKHQQMLSSEPNVPYYLDDAG